jgi:hypothetical protein
VSVLALAASGVTAGCAGPGQATAARPGHPAAGLAPAAVTVRQARRVVSGELAAMTQAAGLSAAALERTRGDARRTLERARRGAGRDTVCGYAVQVSSDATGVSAYRSGMAADARALRRYLAALRRAVAGLEGRLAAVRRAKPGYAGGGGQPGPALVRHKIASARARIGAVLRLASGRIAAVNANVARAYQLSASASRAGRCRSAAAPPAPLPPARLSRRAAGRAPGCATPPRTS